MKIVETGLSNYYGSVEFVSTDDGKYYMLLENHNGMNQIEISKELFEAAKKEFEGKQISAKEN